MPVKKHFPPPGHFSRYGELYIAMATKRHEYTISETELMPKYEDLFRCILTENFMILTQNCKM